jgi:hypothetical protein
VTDFQPGDIVQQKGALPYRDLVVEVANPLDQRPQFKGHIHVRRLGWVLAEEWEIYDEKENNLRREILAILKRGNALRDWPENEVEAYRQFGWDPGMAAVNHIRINKIIKAVREHEGA